MKLFVIIFLLAPTLSIATPNCEDGNAMPQEHAKMIESLGFEWMKNATYCDFGTFQVLAPTNPNKDSIALFKGGELFMLHQRGFGINLFQSYGLAKPVPYLSVQDLNHDNVYDTLDYSIIDKSGRIVGDVKDRGMNGDSIVLKYTK